MSSWFARSVCQSCTQRVISLSHSSMSPQQIREVLDEIEIANIKIHGYGSVNFARNLSQCYQRLSERDISEQDLEAVKEYAYDILKRPIELLPGVVETLGQLSPRHELTLFTKGDPEEQRLKLDRSGLRDHFRHVAIVREKNVTAYQQLACNANNDVYQCVHGTSDAPQAGHWELRWSGGCLQSLGISCAPAPTSFYA